MLQEDAAFDEQGLEPLAPYLERLPRPVRLVVWAEAEGSAAEQEALRLAEALAGRFSIVEFVARPRRPNYNFYPVLGVMGLGEEGEEVDYRLRFIGLPAGYQINSLVGAIQTVSFRASNMEGRTRLLLSRLKQEINLELFTAADNEGGVPVATLLSGMAVASPYVNSYVIRADSFPAAAIRYSVRNLPHTVINGRYHVEGLMDEETLLAHLSRAVKGKSLGD